MISGGSGHFCRATIEVQDNVFFYYGDSGEGYMKLHSPSLQGPREPNRLLRLFRFLGASGNECWPTAQLYSIRLLAKLWF